MVPTKEELEEKLQKIAKIVDSTVTHASSLLETAANDPQKLDDHLKKLGRQSVAFIKKQKLELEIRILKLRLFEVEKRITTKLEKKEGKESRSE